MQFSVALGPLIVLALLNSPLFVGLTSAILSGSRFIASYPFGRLTDRYGRKPGLYLGLALGLIGALVVGWGTNAGSLAGFVVGLVCFSVGMNGVQQLRLAAAEMYPPDRRAFVLGLILSGSLVGVVVAPSMVALAETVAPSMGISSLALPWLFFPALLVPASVMVSLVRPDPREIAVNLSRYYPAYRATVRQESARGFGVRAYLANAQRRLATLTMLCATAAMQMAMITVPLQLHQHGHSIAQIALSASLHIGGMFGLSIPVGKLADRFGYRIVLIAGALVEMVGAAITTLGTDYVTITAGILLVGIGWCGANVSSTAMVMDATAPAARGRAVGILDTASALGVVFPLSVGVLVAVWGVGVAGVVAIVILLPALVASLRTAASTRPGLEVEATFSIAPR